MIELSLLEKDQLFNDFYLKKEPIKNLCAKYKISRYQFYKFKKTYLKKSFYDYSLEEWVKACLEIDPDSSAEEIRKYLSYVNKTEYTLEEIKQYLN
jgi:hypothetical protein